MLDYILSSKFSIAVGMDKKLPLHSKPYLGWAFLRMGGRGGQSDPLFQKILNNEVKKLKLVPNLGSH